MRSLGMPELLIVFCLVVVFLVPLWRIGVKAGYPGWIAIMGCVPILNILALWWFAFAEWPSLRRR